MKIKIRNLQKKVRIRSIKELEKVAIQVLKSEGIKGAEVSILLVDNKTIRRFNRKYRGIDRATDVLAFSQQEGRFSGLNPDLLGDIIISVDKARTQSRNYKQSFKKELCLYLIHGCLHLLGYEDRTERDRKRMQKKQEGVFDELCGSN